MATPLEPPAIQVYWPQAQIIYTTPYRSFYRTRKGWRGDKETPYTYQGRLIVSEGYQTRLSDGKWIVIEAGNTRIGESFLLAGGLPAWAKPSYNTAYERFKEKATGEQAALGTFFAEWRESLGMVNKRALQLYTGARNLRKGDILGFAETFGIVGRVKRKHRKMPRKDVATKSSELWLEYWFGWAPCVSEITSLAGVMGQPFPSAKARGTATGYWLNQSNNSVVQYDDWCKIQHRIGGRITVTNYNTFLLNQMGLLNWGSVAWELVPFSFLADWATDVGSYFQSFTDWAGCSLTKPWSISVLRFDERTKSKSSAYRQSEWQSARGICTVRRTSIPAPLPNWQVSANLGKSLTRVVTSMALLTTTLASMRGMK